MRRTLLALLLAALFLPFSFLSVVAAQEATPATGESAFAGLGLPELDITVTPTGFEGLPEEIEAGRYLVTITAADDLEFGGGAGFVLPPEGMTVDEYLAAHAGEGGPAEVEGEVPGGTPILAGEATPVVSEPAQSIFDATYAGGLFLPTGASAQVVLDLPPGDWLAWGGYPDAPQEPVPFTVTGEMPADLPEPEAGAVIEMGEYFFEISEGALTAGQQVLELQNVGEQLHFLDAGMIPNEVTEEDIAEVLEIEQQAELTGTPPVFTDFNPEEDYQPYLSTGTQSGARRSGRQSRLTRGPTCWCASSPIPRTAGHTPTTASTPSWRSRSRPRRHHVLIESGSPGAR